MGLVKAFSGALSGTLQDQWIDIIKPAPFDEQTVVVPGLFADSDGSNVGVLTNGSKILVPENTTAIIFNQGKVDEVVDEPGGYQYYDYLAHSVFDESGKGASSITGEVRERMRYGGKAINTRRIVFVNLREIRGVRFGTQSPVPYHDNKIDETLKFRTRGTLSLKIADPQLFVSNFVPASASYYSFADIEVRAKLLPEFLQSLAAALDAFSGRYRILETPSHTREILEEINSENTFAGTWRERFGIEIVTMTLDALDLTQESRELIRKHLGQPPEEEDQLAEKKPDLDEVLDDVDRQIESIRKLKELLDMQAITKKEFDAKKKQILGL